VQRLRRLARPDVDHLREVQLIARRVPAEHLVAHTDHSGMEDEVLNRGRTCEQAAGSSRVATREAVLAHRRHLAERSRLVEHGGDLLRSDRPLDDHGAVAEQRAGDVGRRIGRLEVFETHRSAHR
jgi:hypothetical protein